MVPLAAFYSALCLALATFAKSNKEGQYYLYPILMVSIGLTVFCLSPLVELTPLYAALPVVNVSLLLKALLGPGGASGALPYVPVVLLSSVGYAAAALWWAVEQFKREDVLFREAERFNPPRLGSPPAAGEGVHADLRRSRLRLRGDPAPPVRDDGSDAAGAGGAAPPGN